jgi:hypothetical protein
MRLYDRYGIAYSIPDIDAPIWISLHGYTTIPPDELQPIIEPIVELVALPTGSKALELINGVSLASELELLPSIGRKAAQVILDNRPESGYLSLDQVWELCPRLLKAPYQADPIEIERWGNDGDTAR